MSFLAFQAPVILLMLPVLFTLLCAVAALAAAYAVSLRILRNHAAAVLVVLPLMLSIPWDKQFPAIGDALALLASVGVLYFWLSAEAAPSPGRAALLGALVMVALRPDVFILALVAVVTYALRRPRLLPPARAASACAAIVAAAVLSALVVNPASPSVVLSGLVERLRSGLAWDGSNWIFAGTDIRTSLRSATSYGATFYVPLVVAFVFLAAGYRRDWWFVPVSVWTACVFFLTARAVEPLVLRACPPLIAALLIFFGTAAVLRLRREFPGLDVLLGPAPSSRR